MGMRILFLRKWPRGGSTPCTAECLEPSELYSARSQGLNSHFASNAPNKTMSLENKSFCGYIWIFWNYTRPHEMKYFNKSEKYWSDTLAFWAARSCCSLTWHDAVPQKSGIYACGLIGISLDP